MSGQMWVLLDQLGALAMINVGNICVFETFTTIVGKL